VGAIAFAKSVDREERFESHAPARGPMTLIVLATTGLLACAFYIYVLCQWMRDARGERTPPSPMVGQSGGTQEHKRLYIMASRKTADRHNSDVESYKVPRTVRQSHGRQPEWSVSERIAYRKIANSLSSRKRS
jgi:hypothetical protein